ncbi:hypothetical protein BDV93DRAFT_523134 [Ceratobasidium sp. AG-I]|nr:hypothetical protein BDV93DRAFT_523134 [Ceratobasidium sp. AG-I]
MSDIYECSGCRYTTGLDKSIHLHYRQCSAYARLQEIQEELLRCKRKRKLEEAGNPSLTSARLQNLRFKLNDGQQTDTEAPFEALSNNLSSIEAVDIPSILPPPVAHSQPPSEHTSGSVSQPPDYPTYRPTLGRYREEHDRLPEPPPAPLDDLNAPAASQTPTLARIRRVRHVNPKPVPYETLPDSFGQYRVYPATPDSIPDLSRELADVCDIRTASDPHKPTVSRGVPDIIAPCPNVSAFRLQYWHWNQGDKKSKGARESLVQDVISAPDFVPSDVHNLDWCRMDRALASDTLDTSTGWNNDSLRLKIPPPNPAAATEFRSNHERGTLLVPGFKHRTLVSTVVDALSNNDRKSFHYGPYTARCKDPQTSEPYDIFGEAYESKRMRDMHEAIQKIKLDEPCSLPRCAAMIMVFSDATQLAAFGHASAWPIRISFGNQSKYERCKPSNRNNYELGFIPSLPPDLQETLRNVRDGRPVPKPLLTHLRRELIHEVWNKLLDNEFLQAWRHGIVICCADGIKRRVFPRIFSYSADYPEKVLLATIRGMKSHRPCPRCFIPRAEFPNLGIPEDVRRRGKLKRIDDKARNDLVAQARSFIFIDGRAIGYKGVELLLKPHSYTPTENAFSRRLRLFGFDIFESLTVDLLHEFELGVWKSVFLHLLRILHSTDSRSVIQFNERFRLIPSFGDGTIRPFSEDVSNMSRPAARNYEDVLQCIIPAIEGLMPRIYEQQIITLLFVLCQWHGLAKLRQHTSKTIDVLRRTTTRLGHELREFRRYTSEFEVYETPKEVTTRQKRTLKKARPRAALAFDSDCLDEANKAIPARQRKYFNLETSKLHALGDYPEMIETFGTTDSFSTQTGESLHAKTKRRYARTNGRDYLSQMGEIGRIEARLNAIQEELKAKEANETATSPVSAGLLEEGILTTDDGRVPYQIALSQRNPVSLSVWVERNRSDPAIKTFIPRLKSHLLARLSSQHYQDESSHSVGELSQINIQHDRIYAHQTLKIHYTTYDVRRAQDIINPRTPKRFILVPSGVPEDSLPGAHMFWYAKVIGIYHANVSYKGRPPRRMDFLWVRWLGRMLDAPGGWDNCRLDQVEYFPDSELTHAFDFVDPIDVIRAAHLIPRFVGGRTSQYLEPALSMAIDSSSFGDWSSYYINRWVDFSFVNILL